MIELSHIYCFIFTNILMLGFCSDLYDEQFVPGRGCGVRNGISTITEHGQIIIACSKVENAEVYQEHLKNTAGKIP